MTSESERVEGWRAVADREGLPHGPELVAYGDITEEGGYTAGIQLLSTHGRPWAVHGALPTAVLATNDAQAVGLISACAELGLRVPEDVAIVSIGGTRIAPYTVPPLTTVRQDVEMLAGVGAGHLLARIAETTTPVTVELLRGNLVVGRSCGCDVHAGQRR